MVSPPGYVGRARRRKQGRHEGRLPVGGQVARDRSSAQGAWIAHSRSCRRRRRRSRHARDTPSSCSPGTARRRQLPPACRRHERRARRGRPRLARTKRGSSGDALSHVQLRRLARNRGDSGLDTNVVIDREDLCRYRPRDGAERRDAASSADERARHRRFDPASWVTEARSPDHGLPAPELPSP